MKLIPVVLLLSCLASAQHSTGDNSPNIVGNSVTVTFASDGHRVVHETKIGIIGVESDGRFAGAVKFPANTKADKAIVTVYYWQYTKDFGKLLRSRDFVVTVMPGAAVMFDDVPAPRKDVRNVEVTLVRDISKQKLDKFEGDVQ